MFFRRLLKGLICVPSTARNHCRSAILLSAGSKIFEKLPNNWLANRIKNCGVFSKIKHGFRSSQSSADLLPDVSNRISKTSNRFGATPSIELDISKAFTELKRKSYGVLGRAFDHISHFLGNRRFGVVLNETFLKKYSTNALVAQGFILGPNLFVLYINDLLDDAMCNIVIYANNTSFYSKCDQHQISDL